MIAASRDFARKQISPARSACAAGSPPRAAPHRPRRSCRAPGKAWRAVARPTASHARAASARPMLRRPASLHPQASIATTSADSFSERRRLGPRQPAAQPHLFARVDAMKLKETLGRVRANARSLFTGGPSLMKSLTSLITAHGCIMAHGCPVAAVRPKIQGWVGTPWRRTAGSPALRPTRVLALTIPLERSVF